MHRQFSRRSSLARLTPLHPASYPQSPAKTRFSGNVFALINTNRRQGIRVSAETCVPEWGGEAMDSDMIIAKLVELEGD